MAQRSGKQSAWGGVSGWGPARQRIALWLTAVCLAAAAPAVMAQAPAPAKAAPADAAAKAAPRTEPAAASGTPPNTKAACLECHDDKSMTDDAGKSLAVLAEDYARTAHRKLDCAECHDAALSTKHPKNPLGAVKPQLCRDCHADEFKAVTGTPHGRRVDGERAVKDCAGCHGNLHSTPRGKDPDSPLSAVNQIKTCGSCHADVVADYENSEHARALLKAGLVKGAPSCTACHGAHEVHGKDHKDSSTHPSKVSATCGACHVTIQKVFDSSVHGSLLASGKPGKDGKEAPNCATCHSPHAIKEASALQNRADMAKQCGTCHEKLEATFKDSFHGKATALKHDKAPGCASCHTPHGTLPKSDPKSSVHPDNLAATCGACHKNTNAAFLSFDPHANPSDPTRNRYLYWIWFGMTGLLMGVFGFFGLHGALWLQRAVVGKLRGEYPAHVHTGQHVRRFNSLQIAIHVTIVTSFLLLAATGLPLKFAHTDWAPHLMKVFGGPVVAGWLHRFAGAVTFGYFAWHLAMLAHGLLVRREKGYFWGPRSMVPQPRDLFDLIAMFRYFLYMGPRPQFDRFTYWEKFDYLAVFWGVAIIGLSGLVLWFPAAFTTVLPGWALNAAYVIHSDEALLATGFIFLFHFFHTHLRPESFPMDTVIFTGRMPLEVFKAERPLEYERLVREGKLEERLAPAPTPLALRVAYVFGFTAVAIGVTLAVFIFRALWSGLH